MLNSIVCCNVQSNVLDFPDMFALEGAPLQPQQTSVKATCAHLGISVLKEQSLHRAVPWVHTNPTMDKPIALFVLLATCAWM